jgi:hypothetical protein
MSREMTRVHNCDHKGDHKKIVRRSRVSAARAVEIVTAHAAVPGSPSTLQAGVGRATPRAAARKVKAALECVERGAGTVVRTEPHYSGMTTTRANAAGARRTSARQSEPVYGAFAR